MNYLQVVQVFVRTPRGSGFHGTQQDRVRSCPWTGARCPPWSRAGSLPDRPAVACPDVPQCSRGYRPKSPRRWGPHQQAYAADAQCRRQQRWHVARRIERQHLAIVPSPADKVHSLQVGAHGHQAQHQRIGRIALAGRAQHAPRRAAVSVEPRPLLETVAAVARAKVVSPWPGG